MRVYYDGSFDGFLTVLFEILVTKQIYQDIGPVPEQTDFFDDSFHMETDEAKAKAIMEKINDELSASICRELFYAFLSSEYRKERVLYQYLNVLFREGVSASNNFLLPEVRNFHNLYRSLIRERHAYLGILRFQQLVNGWLYAEIEPNNHIIPLLASHFQQRLPKESWIICDKKRGQACIYHNGQLSFSTLQGEPELDQQEDYYQDLWKQFFHSIAIQERKNPSLQRSHLPKKYWKYLIEMKD